LLACIRALDPQDEANRIPLAWCQGMAAAMRRSSSHVRLDAYYPYFWLLISMTIIMPDFVTVRAGRTVERRAATQSPRRPAPCPSAARAHAAATRDLIRS
jgi:hypothetical protein